MTTQSKNTQTQTSIAAILAATPKKTGKSAYGSTVELICKDLALLNDRDKLNSELKKLGIEAEEHKNAVQTGISQTRKVVELLVQNNYLK